MKTCTGSAVIFIGGDYPSVCTLNWQPDSVIAADSGVYACRDWGYSPDMVVGDFDSIPIGEAKRIFPNAEYMPYPAEKDSTDTEIAIETAQSKHCTDITLIGGEGRRLDHFISLLYLFSRDTAPSRMIMCAYQIEYIDHTFELAMDRGAYISFFPVGTTHCRQTSSGLKYPLDDVILTPHMLSSSNEAVDSSVCVTLLQGTLIAVWAHHNAITRPTQYT